MEKTQAIVPLHKKSDLTKFTMPDMTNYNPDILASPRDIASQKSDAVRSMKPVKSLSKIKPKTRVMSIDIEKKDKDKLIKKKVDSSTVYQTGPKTPVVKKTKLGSTAKIDGKGKSTIKKSAKKLTNDLTSSPSKSTVKAKYVDS